MKTQKKITKTKATKHALKQQKAKKKPKGTTPKAKKAKTKKVQVKKAQVKRLNTKKKSTPKTKAKATATPENQETKPKRGVPSWSIGKALRSAQAKGKSALYSSANRKKMRKGLNEPRSFNEAEEDDFIRPPQAEDSEKLAAKVIEAKKAAVEEGLPGDEYYDVLKMYLREMDSKSLFTPEQEIEVAREMSEHTETLRDILESLAFVDEEVDETNEQLLLDKLKRFVDRIEAQERNIISAENTRSKTRLGKDKADERVSDARAAIRKTEREAGIKCNKLKQCYAEVHVAHEQVKEKRNQFVEANLRLVVKIANKYRNKSLTVSDLIQEGNLGLIRAVEKFDYRKGYKFSSYATWWIHQAIIRALAEKSKTIRVPIYLSEKIKRVDKIATKLYQKRGKEPTPEEIAEEMELPLEEVISLIKIAREPVSLEKLIGKYEEISLGNLIEDKSVLPPEEEVVNSHLSRQVEELLESLSPREEKILRMRYGIGEKHDHTLEEIGEDFKLSRERIRQIEKKSLKKLRHPSKSRLLRSYFES